MTLKRNFLWLHYIGNKPCHVIKSSNVWIFIGIFHFFFIICAFLVFVWDLVFTVYFSINSVAMVVRERVSSIYTILRYGKRVCWYNVCASHMTGSRIGSMSSHTPSLSYGNCNKMYKIVNISCTKCWTVLTAKNM